MMMVVLQKLGGKPNPTITAKLFGLARAMKHLYKTSYEFFRLNTLVGPHLDTIAKFERKSDDAPDELVVAVDDNGCQHTISHT